MENKSFIQTLREFGMTQREAEEEIRKAGVEEIPSYQLRKTRQAYDIFCPLGAFS